MRLKRTLKTLVLEARVMTAHRLPNTWQVDKLFPSAPESASIAQLYQEQKNNCNGSLWIAVFRPSRNRSVIFAFPLAVKLLWTAKMKSCWVQIGVCPSWFLHLPYQTGTATSSPFHTEPSQSINVVNVVNVMLWMKRNAYEETTIKATSKRGKSRRGLARLIEDLLPPV